MKEEVMVCWEHICRECNNVFKDEKRRRSCPKCGSSRLIASRRRINESLKARKEALSRLYDMEGER